MKRIFLIILISVVMLSGCTANETYCEKSSDKLCVVTTIFPIYDFVRAVGGANTEIKLLIAPGTEVHSFDPKPSDIRSIYNADLFMYIGGESDEWVNSLINEINIDKLKFIDIVETLDEESDDSKHSHHGHSHGGHEADEHIWTSPSNAAVMLEAVADKLSGLDPENSERYNSNAQSYITEISEISAEISALVAKTENPFLLVADRFPFKYFVTEYGIAYEAAMGGCANSSDISLKAMKRLMEAVEKEKITTAYYTEMSGKSIADALREETGVKLLELQSGHNITLKEFKSGITYADLLRQNLEALREGWNG